MTGLRETRAALGDGVLVVVDAGRLLLRHFPALLSVFLLGLACRNGVLWAAVRIGRDHPVLASLLLPLAPLAMVITLVIMLRIAGSALGRNDEVRTIQQRVGLLMSALVPFLTVYTVTGQLEADKQVFLNESFADEQYRGTAFSDAGLGARSIVDFPHLQAALLAACLVIRFSIDILDLDDKHVGWGVVQVLAEVTWLTLFARYLTTLLDYVRGWFDDLVVVTWVEDAWREATGWLGPFAAPIRAVVDLFSETLDRISPIVLTPLLWLAVGAVVLVGGLPENRRARLAAAPRTASRLTARLAPRVTRMRSGRVRAKTFELLGSRFADLGDGLRVLVHAGLLPALAFCLVLPLARLAQWGSGELFRQIVGPRDPETMILFSRYTDIVQSAVYTLVVVVIAVAAVERLLFRREREQVQPVTVG